MTFGVAQQAHMCLGVRGAYEGVSAGDVGFGVVVALEGGKVRT